MAFWMTPAGKLVRSRYNGDVYTCDECPCCCKAYQSYRPSCQAAADPTTDASFIWVKYGFGVYECEMTSGGTYYYDHSDVPYDFFLDNGVSYVNNGYCGTGGRGATAVAQGPWSPGDCALPYTTPLPLPDDAMAYGCAIINASYYHSDCGECEGGDYNDNWSHWRNESIPVYQTEPGGPWKVGQGGAYLHPAGSDIAPNSVVTEFYDPPDDDYNGNQFVYGPIACGSNGVTYPPEGVPNARCIYYPLVKYVYTSYGGFGHPCPENCVADILLDDSPSTDCTVWSVWEDGLPVDLSDSGWDDFFCADPGSDYNCYRYTRTAELINVYCDQAEAYAAIPACEGV